MLNARLDFLRDVLEVEWSQKVSEALWPQCNIRQIGETAQWYDEREKQHKGCVRNQDDNNALFRHIKETGHDIAWERVEFLEFEQRTYCRKMKESFYIDMHAAKDGVMNPRDGTQKDSCWNTIINKHWY